MTLLGTEAGLVGMVILGIEAVVPVVPLLAGETELTREKVLLGGGGGAPGPEGEKNRSSSIFTVFGVAGESAPLRPMPTPLFPKEDSEASGGDRAAKGWLEGRALGMGK